MPDSLTPSGASREATREELTELARRFYPTTVRSTTELLVEFAELVLAHRSAADRQEIERLKADAENMLWNLGGISTVALGYFKEDQSFDRAAARPALLETMELRKRYDANRAELAKLRTLLEKLPKIASDFISEWFGATWSELGEKLEAHLKAALSTPGTQQEEKS